MVVLTVKAQTIGAKTNFLYDATANSNVGIRIGMVSYWIFDASRSVSVWNMNSERKWNHWFVPSIISFKTL